MKNLSLTQKLIASFMSIAVLLLIVGGLSYTNLVKISQELGEIQDMEPLIEASLETELSVKESNSVLNEMSPAASSSEVEKIWARHEHAVKDFDAYTKAIVSGGETPKGMVKATHDEHLRSLVQNAQETHRTQYVPMLEKTRKLIDQMHSLKTKATTLTAALDDATETLDERAEQLSQTMEEIEQTRMKDTSAAAELLVREVRWSGTLREVQIAIARSAGLICEIELADEASKMTGLRARYDSEGARIEELLGAVMRGGTVDHLSIPKVDDPKLARSIEDLHKVYTQTFKPTAEAAVKNHQELLAVELTIAEERHNAERMANQMTARLEEVEGAILAQSKALGTRAQNQAHTAELESEVGVGVGFVLALVLGLVMARSISKPITQVISGMSAASEEVSSASENVSAASQELAAGATEQASNIEETSSAMEEMAAMAGQNAEYADTANKVGLESRTAVAKGTQNLDQMVASMAEIEVAFNKVSKIVRSIEEIAFQTNLLSLNASLEAAGAGEHGKRFAVVADEVRNLSLKAEEAARETVALIQDANERVRQGSASATTLHDSFASIESSSDKVGSLLAEIQAASREQARGADQVGRAMVQLDQATQGNASAAEETAASSEELAAQAMTLNDLVEALHGIVAGAKAGSAQSKVNQTKKYGTKSNGTYASATTSTVKPQLSAMQKAKNGQADAAVLVGKADDGEEGGFRQF